MHSTDNCHAFVDWAEYGLARICGIVNRLCTELKHGMAANRDERNGIGIIIAALKVMKDKAAARDSK